METPHRPCQWRGKRADPSIVIANPTVLVGYERGDWVEARGRLSTPNPAGQDSVPRYEVVDIQRVGT